MFLQHETPTTFGKLSTDKNSILGSKTIKPLFRALKYILSPCNAPINVRPAGGGGGGGGGEAGQGGGEAGQGGGI